jgi:hypothetical protein
MSTRMTVVRLRDGSLWLHSPTPIGPDLHQALAALGSVRYIVAPNRFHHMYAGDALRLFPQAQLFGPRSLRRKRPDLVTLRELAPQAEPEWVGELGQIPIEGIPAIRETAFFHRASGSLILTDLCQCWEGKLPVLADWYARATGARHQLAIPLTIRLATRDKAALRASLDRLVRLPVSRIIVAHNTVVERDAARQLRRVLEAMGA